MPDMKQQLTTLYDLQQADTGIALHKRALRQLDDGSETAARLAAAREQLAALNKAHQDLEGALLDRELRLKGAEQERATKSKQAYGGTISDPKQLAALEKKIEELGRQKARLEEEMLELMEQLDQSQATIGKQQAAVEELDKRVTALRERHGTESRRLKRELDDLLAQREQLAASTDEAFLKQYESLREKVGGIAVAAVHKGSCQGCKVSLPSTYAQRLRAGDQLVRCESCRRILYLPSGESPFKPEDDM